MKNNIFFHIQSFVCVFLYKKNDFLHNKTMKEKINHLIKTISYVNRKINPSLLASALTFYFTIAFLPFYQLILYLIGKLEITDHPLYIHQDFNWLNMIVYIASTIWASSKFIHTLHLISDVMYFKVKERPRFKLRVLSFIYTLFLLFIIIVEIILVFYFGYVKQRCNTPIYILISIVETFFPFLLLFTIFSLLYKYIIPIRIKLKEVWKTGLVIACLVYVLMILYQQIFQNYLLGKYMNVYGTYANIVSLIIWIYLNCYIFLIGMGTFFIKSEYN